MNAHGQEHGENRDPVIDRAPVAEDGKATLQTRPGIHDAEGLDEQELRDRRNKAATFGMILFLAGLTMLFIAGMILYVIKRFQSDAASFDVPLGLWFSTGVILVSGLTVWGATASLKDRKFGAFRASLLATLVLGLLFVGIQIPSLLAMLESGGARDADDPALYRIAVFLIVVHALHVVGGIAFLIVGTFNALRRRFEAGAEFGWIRQLAMYWHYVDAVWMVMFGLFVLLG